MTVLDDFWKFSIKTYQGRPDVTIIIPAFDQVEMTVNCLIAVARTLEMCETSAEVILVDDASAQNFGELFQDFRGLRVLRNETNIGFLKSCNGAVQLAEGQDIVLLNNDTIPTGLWLDHLVNFRKTHHGVLVVGSRLVSADGRLQESGGIIFNDGSGWNFGRDWNWDDPRCSYPREVDYCSGAAILIDGGFARLMGPFDERYVPAYYEDTDLCFEARSMGGSVWVEPRAVVVHLEGMSYGKESDGHGKEYQIKNAKIFADKWKIDLIDQFPPGDIHVWRARTRHDKPRIVFVDNEVPQFDNNSGALRTVSILRLMIESGFEVIFIPINGLRSEPHTSVLESLGIEVLGPLPVFTDYLKSIKETIKQVWVSRADVASRVLPLIDFLLTDIPLVFDTVDLHYLRMEREELLTNRFGRSQQVKKREIEVCNRSEKVIVVSEVEREALQRYTATPIHVLSNIHSVKCISRVPPDNFRAVFVGSFRHTPNIDAVHWFIEEVMPYVLQEIPQFELLIVGNNPPSSLVDLGSPSVLVKGWVEDLEELLNQVRLNIAPLRYGAGVKGKISHSLSIGLPTVTTTIGAEGMNLTNSKDIEIADTPLYMAERICLLLKDNDLWSKLCLEGQLTAQREFGFDSAQQRLMEVLN
jgi:GT2 family glycosyltransferase/glycosyltransferase involved in cell wall biosynthesis